MIHPVDNLLPSRKHRIYYARVVDVAVFQGLLEPDPDTEIGHFAFSAFYREGKELDRDLQVAIAAYVRDYPEKDQARRLGRDPVLAVAVEEYRLSPRQSRLQDLILTGASHAVWPVGCSFALTYPWDLEFVGREVRFRDDLNEFQRRRMRAILKKAGKLRNPHLFEKQ
jgi:hypothetical protein